MKKYLVILCVSVIVTLALYSKFNVNETINETAINEKNEEIDVEQNNQNIEDSHKTNKIELENFIFDISKDTREISSEGLKFAETLIIEEMSKFDCDVDIQTYPVYTVNHQTVFDEGYLSLNPLNEDEAWAESNNLIFKGSDFDSNKKNIIVSAHYDSTSDSIGVIDNATGVSAVVEIAKILKNVDMPYNIIYIFFGSEEYNMYGSKYYVNNLSEKEKENILGNINIDMLGEKDMEGLVFNVQSQYENVLTRMYTETSGDNKSLDILMGGKSDEYSFKNILIPSVTITQGGDTKAFEKTDEQTIINDTSLLDIDELVENIEQITEYIIRFDINKYTELNASKEKIYNDNEIFSVYDITSCEINDYKLSEKYYMLLEPNGYSSQYTAVYKNNNNETYRVSNIFKPNNYKISNDFELIRFKDGVEINYENENLKQNNIKYFENKVSNSYIFEHKNFIIFVDGQVSIDDFFEIISELR